MALAQYQDQFWFPDGILATSVRASVFPIGSSALAALWSDAAGTVPLSNPLNTDVLGRLTFYATVGQYWVQMDSESFLIDVGMSEEQADLTTGVSSGGRISVNGLNPKAVDIAPLIGYVVSNNATTPGAPGVVRVDYPGATIQLDAAAQLRVFTYWLMDSVGVVIQQATKPTNTQRRTHLPLGITVYSSALGSIIESQVVPVILPQQGNQLADLMDSLGPFSITGNRISPNGVNLSFNKSTGTVFSRAFNHYAGGILTNDPHVSTSAAQTPAQFRRTVQVTPAIPSAVVTTVDPANYDVGGVITPVGGGANTATIQRVWLFATNIIQNTILVQYGQATYPSLFDAVGAVGGEPYVVPPITAEGSLIGYIVLIRTATNLSDTTQARLISAGKFATP